MSSDVARAAPAPAPRARAELAAEVVRLIAGAAAAGERLVVLGSLPPEGRDLDLLVPRSARPSLERALSEGGLVGRGSQYALFAGLRAYGVELIEAESFLGPAELRDLFGRAIPLPGAAPLARPAPEHALLILARLAHEEGGLWQKRRRRLERIEAEAPEAWARAQAEADAWGVGAALARLRAWGLASGGSTPIHTLPWARRVAGRLRAGARHGWPLLVSFSGIDGSGKSSQTRWLHEALTELGVDNELIWNDLLGSAALDVVAKPAKAALRALRRDVGQMSDYAGDGAGADVAAPATRAGARGLWSAYVTLTNGLAQRTLTAGARLRGRVVVFDRGPLDLAVRMSVLYGNDPARAARIVALTAPRPDLSFFLDIPPELSLERKLDVWTAAQLRHHVDLYRALAGRFDVRRVDGTRPAEEIAAEIGREVWLHLRG